MVERSLSMREVPGSIPGISKPFVDNFLIEKINKDSKIYRSNGDRIEVLDKNFEFLTENYLKYNFLVQDLYQKLNS